MPAAFALVICMKIDTGITDQDCTMETNLRVSKLDKAAGL
jgi:hypothetical protein